MRARPDSVTELLEHWETLVETLSRDNLVLRAERDEARRVLSEMLDKAQIPTEASRFKSGHPRQLTDEMLAKVAHLSNVEASRVLHCHSSSVSRARNRHPVVPQEPLRMVR